MNQKRVDMAIALAACEEAELNMTQLCAFLQDSIELGYPPAVCALTYFICGIT